VSYNTIAYTNTIRNTMIMKLSSLAVATLALASQCAAQNFAIGGRTTGTVDEARTDVNIPVVIDVLANDYSDDSGFDRTTIEFFAIRISLVSDGASVSVDTDTGLVTYTPKINFSGRVNGFTYEFIDYGKLSGSAAVFITVVDDFAASSAPSAGPSATPSAGPTTTPSATASGTPSVAPSSFPTAGPSAVPSDGPTTTPSATASGTPSVAPSSAPSAGPSVVPTSSAGPTTLASAAPSGIPSATPTKVPSSFPSTSPTSVPSRNPSRAPSESPSVAPSNGPSSSPSAVPTISAEPTIVPSTAPSGVSSTSPTSVPSGIPSRAPSEDPSVAPSFSPSQRPTALPTRSSTEQPSQSPTKSSQPSIFCVAEGNGCTPNDTCCGEGANVCVGVCTRVAAAVSKNTDSAYKLAGGARIRGSGRVRRRLLKGSVTTKSIRN
jgi:hypothetical protein